MKIRQLPSSFRDPSGFVFVSNKVIYRQVNYSYSANFDFLIKSGLYKTLVDKKLLIEHQEVDGLKSTKAYKTLKPQKVPFISYPYEWSFNQLKDAARVTLTIQKLALDHGMVLKDASSFNIQFIDGKPIFIDTLSFEKYKKGSPWIAYKQFCENFLAPLALASYEGAESLKFLQPGLGSVSLELASRALPFRARSNFGLLIHVFFHQKSQRKYENVKFKKADKQLKLSDLAAIIKSLEDTISSLKLPGEKTIWTDYYQTEHPSYDTASFQQKKSIVEGFLKKAKPNFLWDIGANTGEFSKISSALGIPTIALDNDHTVIEGIYHEITSLGIKNLLPLWVDITKPSPALGWNLEERLSIFQRGLPSAVLALALMHHLVISNNLSFQNLASFFAQVSKTLIIEFIPKDDPQVKRLLQNRVDDFPDYTKENFLREFNQHYKIVASEKIKSSNRIMYLMERK